MNLVAVLNFGEVERALSIVVDPLLGVLIRGVVQLRVATFQAALKSVFNVYIYSVGRLMTA